MTDSSSTALIIGASRGLGLELVRQYTARGWTVIATIRGERPGALGDLAAQAGGRIEIERLEITDAAQIAALRERLAKRRIDLLFVNAGVSNGPAETVGGVSNEEFTRVMLTNTLGPMRVIEALQDLVPPSGTIAVMSSGLGSVADNERGGWEVYRASKAALNTLMRSFAARAAGARSLVVVAPGWVRTDMGGPQATLDAETSISGIVETLAKQAGKPGIRYLNYQGKTVRW